MLLSFYAFNCSGGGGNGADCRLTGFSIVVGSKTGVDDIGCSIPPGSQLSCNPQIKYSYSSDVMSGKNTVYSTEDGKSIAQVNNCDLAGQTITVTVEQECNYIGIDGTSDRLRKCRGEKTVSIPNGVTVPIVVDLTCFCK